MKSIFFIIAIFGINITASFGEVTGEGTVLPEPGATVCTACPSLIPVVPLVALYEDQSEVTSLMVHDILCPHVPMEADFSDAGFIDTPDESNLMPQVPLQADFQETL